MSDMMRGMGGPPGMGGPSPLDANKSMMSGPDLASMTQGGQVRPDMTIKEFFATFGIDTETDTVDKLTMFAKKQVQNANPVNKMQNMAMGAEPPAPVGAPTAVPPSEGLAGLRSRIGG
ncbi:MAG: hypothetical protein ABIJ57_10860 [Pseudomonadota bacterium]